MGNTPRVYRRNMASYGMEEEILNRALEDPSGIRISPKDPTIPATKAWATKLRQRLNECRVADRQRNAETYPEDHLLHGKSLFDGLVIRSRQVAPTLVAGAGPWFVEVQPAQMALDQLTITSLQDEEEDKGV